MSAPPYMKLYVADYTADVQHLTCEQDGAYWRLLRAMWRAGGTLPNKPEKLATICGLSLDRWAEIGPDVIDLFKINGGQLTHKRLTPLCAKTKRVSKVRSEAAKKGHSEKGNENNASEDDFADGLPGICTYNQNQSQKKKNPPLDPPLGETKRATRLPEGWQPSADERAYAAERGFEPPAIDRMAERFRNYWVSKSGKDATKLDWRRTWQNWVLNEAERRPQQSQKPQQVDWC